MRAQLRWVSLVIVLAAAFGLLRLVHAGQPAPLPSAIFTSQVVVVGVAGRYTTDATDRAVISDHAEDVQAGAVSIRSRYLGACAAAGWTTLGAGRRTAVGDLCDPAVVDGVIPDWAERLAAAKAHSGDAQLGTLAASTAGCVAAVGPGAALAAADPQGQVDHYRTPAEFVAQGYSLECPITLIDAGDRSDMIISELAKNTDITLIVTGIGPPAGSQDRSLQLIYRLGTTLPGWLTSASTRRSGIVNLADLTRTLIDFGRPAGLPAVDLPVDGAVIGVLPAPISVDAVADQLRSVDALSTALLPVYLGIAVGSVALIGLAVIAYRRRKRTLLFALGAILTTMTASLMVTGAVQWNRSSHPSVFLGFLLSLWVVIMTSLALGLARHRRIPIAVAAAILTVAAYTADAALGAVMQPGSLFNSQPTNGGRWYGFGNVTFAAYAAAGLLVAGYLAHRLIRRGTRGWAVIAVLGVGLTVILCEGWPSMGTDFGGVIALAPGVLWLAIVVSGRRVTPVKIIIIGVVALALLTAISVLDWRRGPQNRSHLGNFVQRVIDGDARDIVVRKAVASWHSMTDPSGIIAIALAIAIWLAVFRFLVPQLAASFVTVRPTSIAALVTAILGTVLNDGGASVVMTLTGAFAASLLVLWVEAMRVPAKKPGSVSSRGRHSSRRTQHA